MQVWSGCDRKFRVKSLADLIHVEVGEIEPNVRWISSFVLLFICGRGEGTFWNICIRSSVALQPSVRICQGWLPWSLCSANCPLSSLAEHSGYNVNSWQPNKWRKISIASWSHSAQEKDLFRELHVKRERTLAKWGLCVARWENVCKSLRRPYPG